MEMEQPDLLSLQLWHDDDNFSLRATAWSSSCFVLTQGMDSLGHGSDRGICLDPGQRAPVDGSPARRRSRQAEPPPRVFRHSDSGPTGCFSGSSTRSPTEHAWKCAAHRHDAWSEALG